jgi:hypothetical protein
MVQGTKWPGDREYVDAVQNPRVCFKDQRLRAAAFESNSYGMPRALTGRSAVVFHANVNSTSVAVRCFTRAVLRQKERYEKLNAQLKEQSPPAYLVSFNYRDSEILVGEDRYPVVEMAWSDGKALNEWIDDRYHKRSGDIAAMADSWLSIANDLQDRNIAHGDLANDNCLVGGSVMTLIDYDGCFIPALEKENPGEAGNPHFQHPKRPGYYALDMDAFPAVVIYLSLLAISKNGSLWKKFHMKENLIFTADDYRAPRDTPIWRDLTGMGDAKVTSLTNALAEMCDMSISSLPSLSDLLGRPAVGQGWLTDWSDRWEGQETPAFGPPSPGKTEGWLKTWPAGERERAWEPAPQRDEEPPDPQARPRRSAQPAKPQPAKPQPAKPQPAKPQPARPAQPATPSTVARSRPVRKRRGRQVAAWIAVIAALLIVLILVAH